MAQSALLNEWAPYIRIDTIDTEAKPAWLQAAGRLGYDEEHTQHVRSPVNGRITHVWAALGQQVKPGDALFGLASPEAAQLRAELRKDEEDVAVLRRAHERARSLHQDGAVSPKELAEAQAAYNKAVAELARDTAHVQALGLNVQRPASEALLVARLGGVITAREAAVGTEVRADDGQALAVISDLDRLWLWINVFERDVAQVEKGARVLATVSAWPSKTFAGVIDYIGDVVDAESHTVKVRCILQNEKRLLKPHMHANVRLAQAVPQALVVASDAVVLRGDKNFVIVVGPNEALSLREVELGAIVAGRQVVHKGLVRGEKVIGKGAVLVAQHLRQAT